MKKTKKKNHNKEVYKRLEARIQRKKEQLAEVPRSIIAGVPDGATYPDGTLLSDVFRYLEYGTSKMDAKPILGPVMSQNGSSYGALYTNMLRKYLKTGKEDWQMIADRMSSDLKKQVESNDSIDTGVLINSIKGKVKYDTNA